MSGSIEPSALGQADVVIDVTTVVIIGLTVVLTVVALIVLSLAMGRHGRFDECIARELVARLNQKPTRSATATSDSSAGVDTTPVGARIETSRRRQRFGERVVDGVGRRTPSG